MKKSLKYRFLLKVFKILPIKKKMALPPEEAQKAFRKFGEKYKVPKRKDKELDISQVMVNGFPVFYAKHKDGNDRLVIYLIGGGMLKYPMAKQTKEVMKLAKECDVNFALPYYPTVYTGKKLPDVYAMMYEFYKQMLKEYKAENICFAGGSSGGNLALGLASYINEIGEGLPLPGKIYAGSPGTMLSTEEEYKRAYEQEKTDVIMSVQAGINVWAGMTGGEEVPDYMKFLQKGNYTGLKDVYLSFGGEELFRACAEPIKNRLEEFGVHVTMEIAEGLYHSYAMLPFVKEAEDGYRNFKNYLAQK